MLHHTWLYQNLLYLIFCSLEEEERGNERENRRINQVSLPKFYGYSIGSDFILCLVSTPNLRKLDRNAEERESLSQSKGKD